MLNEYAVALRREIHQYPEIGFDLDKTLAVIRRELDKIGVPYTERYGKSGIVATINPEKADKFTIGIRADIDALPIREVNDVPYKSKIDGQMHACGHDAHCAILLATVRDLFARKDEIACRVQCIFQPAEEYPPSGAKLMAEDGVMDGIDCVIALHVSPGTPCGKIALMPGEQNAISHGFYLDFYGKSSHAANPEAGVDAITMAVRAYVGMQMVVAHEVAAKERVIFNVGTIHGGETNNVICDHCRMFCTLRSWNEKTDEFLIGRFKKIGESVADEMGGGFAYTLSKYYPVQTNDEIVTKLTERAIVEVVGEENLVPHKRSMGGEDFAYFTRLKPGCMFRLGVRNEERGFIHGVHHDNFDLDENALDIGVKIFTRFVFDNMNGIDFPEK